MDNPFESPTIISYCPGILGLDRGLERAIGKVRVAAYVEIEAFIIANLVSSMETGLLDPAPIWTDAKTFPSQPFRGRIHGIIGGYPCPGESVAGLREGHLYKGFLWPYLRRAIAAARPLWCFFENVDDHLTGTFPIVQRSLRNMGYRVEAGIYSAEEVGATHERQRLFILAIMGNASGKHQLHDWYKSIESKRAARRSGAELAYTNGYDAEGRHGNTQGKSQANEGKTQGENGQRLRYESGNGGYELAYSGRTGSQGVQSGLVHRKGKRISGSATECRPQDFPLGQGPEQWDWEEPRTIESGMVYTVNGYNFTPDLHRAIGNSVVEQAAELAFLDLFNEHLAHSFINKTA